MKTDTNKQMLLEFHIELGKPKKNIGISLIQGGSVDLCCKSAGRSLCLMKKQNDHFSCMVIHYIH